MKVNYLISIITWAFILFAIVIGLTLSIQDSPSSLLLKFELFFIFNSIIFSGNYLIQNQAQHTKEITKKISHLFSFSLLIGSGLSFFNFIPFTNTWNYIVSAAIIFITLIIINMLGWAKKKTNLLSVTLFLLIIICGSFLGFIFFSKINWTILSPFIYISTSILTLLFFIGLFQKNDSNHGSH